MSIPADHAQFATEDARERQALAYLRPSLILAALATLAWLTFAVLLPPMLEQRLPANRVIELREFSEQFANLATGALLLACAIVGTVQAWRYHRQST
ncbi:MAG TPA: hypothetical protein VHE37_15385 [Nevskiaceae bacterium]|nr:hypothetical protein [Nevskiaceae bacterium]